MVILVAERSSLYVVSIVALVAVVGLVTLFLRGGADGAASSDLLVDEEGNLVGKAFDMAKVKVTPTPEGIRRSPPPPSRGVTTPGLAPVPLRPLAPQCKDSDGGTIPFAATLFTKGDFRLDRGLLSCRERRDNSLSPVPEFSAFDICLTPSTILEWYCPFVGRPRTSGGVSIITGWCDEWEPYLTNPFFRNYFAQRRCPDGPDGPYYCADGRCGRLESCVEIEEGIRVTLTSGASEEFRESHAAGSLDFSCVDGVPNTHVVP